MEKKLICITGAGISAGSGLLTFAESTKDWRAILDRDYATKNWDRFCEEYQEFVHPLKSAKPNDAHIALAEHDIPIITANVDNLHSKAGSKEVYEIHGCVEMYDPRYDSLVLYGDLLPQAYFESFNVIERTSADLLIIGTTLHTNSLLELISSYEEHSGGDIYLINSDSETKVRLFLDAYYSGKDVYDYCEKYTYFSACGM